MSGHSSPPLLADLVMKTYFFMRNLVSDLLNTAFRSDDFAITLLRS